MMDEKFIIEMIVALLRMAYRLGFDCDPLLTRAQMCFVEQLDAEDGP
jgi:hypothetical protein